jgi:hypothetical protein
VRFPGPTRHGLCCSFVGELPGDVPRSRGIGSESVVGRHQTFSKTHLFPVSISLSEPHADRATFKIDEPSIKRRLGRALPL